MSNTSQDMMGLLSRADVKTPKATDYITIARKLNSKSKIETELITVEGLMNLVQDSSKIRNSYSGTFVNFGVTGGGADVLGGDTVNWGTELNTAVDHLGNLMIMNDCKVSKVSVKWSSKLPIRSIMGSAVVSFKFSKCTNIMADVTDAASWTTAGTVTAQWRASDGEDFPGFLEVKSADNINYAVGDLLAFTASTSSGFSNTGEDVEVGLILEGL